MNSSERHCSNQELVDFAISPAGLQEQATGQHIAACEHCANEATAIGRLLDLIRTDDSEDAPLMIRQRAVRIFTQMRPPALPSALRRLLAALTFDSALRPAAAGIRSGAVLSRQRIFTAGEHQLEIRSKRDGESWEVAGQVLGDEGPGSVQATDARGSTTVAALGSDMQFAFPGLAAGSYTLIAKVGDLEIQVDDFDLAP